jgi:hypothetical protein
MLLKKNAFTLVSFFRSKFASDPGLDGCLLELEEILKLRASNSIGASLLTQTEQGWIFKESTELPPKGNSLNVLLYNGSHSRLEKTPFLNRIKLILSGLMFFIGIHLVVKRFKIGNWNLHPKTCVLPSNDKKDVAT